MEQRAESTQKATRRALLLLAAILVVSTGIKLAFATHVDRLPPRNDETAYLELAEGMLARGEYTSLFRPPAFPAFIALVVKMGGDLEAVRVSQVFLSALTVLLGFAIARRHFGTRVALLFAALMAFDPVLVAFSHLLWSETLYLLLFWSMMALLMLPDFRPRPRAQWFLAGLFLGAAGLARAVVLTVAPIIVGWMLWRGHRGGGASAWSRLRAPLMASCLFAMGALVVVLPWSFRNLRATGAFVLVDTNGAYNFLIGTDPHAFFIDKDDSWSPHWAKLDEYGYAYVAQRDPAYAQRRAIQLGLRYVAENPGRYLLACVFEGAQLWTLDSFPMRHLRNGWYGPHSPAWALPLLVLTSVPLGIVILGAGCLGLLTMPPGPLRTICSIFLLHSVALHTLLFSLSRFQVPMRPLLALGAAWALLHRGQLWRACVVEGRPTRRGWIASAIVAALLIVWFRELPLYWDMLTNGGAEHQFLRRLDAP
ncbi:MAG TPA: glycosyltransferase family 39 protein [Candidatus Krumholzibacteria bacterium]|jgi:4-amino-4-deoxy-L-arabinose transferase-like glycosyltransferase